MPKELEKKLKKKVASKKWSKERKNAYVYGTLRKTGWTPSTQKTHIAIHRGKKAKKVKKYEKGNQKKD